MIRHGRDGGEKIQADKDSLDENREMGSNRACGCSRDVGLIVSCAVVRFLSLLRRGVGLRRTTLAHVGEE